jgi:tetratricopeptide (TPR) repeat protein
LVVVQREPSIASPVARPHILFAAGFILCWSVFAGNSLFAATLGAGLDRGTIRLGETATLTLSFAGAPPDGQPVSPAVSGLNILAAGSSSQMTIINNQRSGIYSLFYQIVPARAGDFLIPPFECTVGGTRLPSPSLNLKVLNPDGSPASPTPQPPPTPAKPVQPAPQPQAPPAQPTQTTEQAEVALLEKWSFTRLIITRNEMYVGEIFPVECQLYFLSGSDIQLPNLRCDGFTVSPVVAQQTRAQIGQQVYNLVNFRSVAIPVKPGKLNFGPAECNLTIHQFPQPGNPFGVSKQVSPKSNVQIINVLPLPPEGRPADFNGAVGSYQIGMSASPTNVAAGEPITLKIQIAGKGALDNVLLPERKHWREFKVYPPTSRVELPNNDKLSLTGAKYFEQVIIPQNADIKEIPSFSFSYFDPEQKAYRILTQPTIPIVVRPSGGGGQQPTIISAATNTPASPGPSDIVHIKPYLGVAGTMPVPLIRQPWFVTVMSLPVIAWLVLLVRRKQEEYYVNNPRLRRQREVKRLIQSGMVELKAHATAANNEKFYATMFRLWQEQLGERLNLPASAITEAVIDDVLRPGGVAETTLTELHELLQICNQARFAPHKQSRELAALLPRMETVLLELQQISPRETSQPNASNKTGLIVSLLWLAAFTVSAADAGMSQFENANKLFEQGKYEEAAAAYETMIRDQKVSPAVCFNAGNAWYRAGHIGRAIYYYRLAGQITPRDADLRANLFFARKTVNGGEAVEPDRWNQFISTLTLNQWTVLASLSLGAFFLLLALREWRPALVSSLRHGLAGSALASVVFVISLGGAVHERYFTKPAVVISKEAVVRYGPLAESKSFYTLRDGSEITVLDQKDGWYQIIDPAKRSGWVRQENLAFIHSPAPLKRTANSSKR